MYFFISICRIIIRVLCYLPNGIKGIVLLHLFDFYFGWRILVFFSIAFFIAFRFFFLFSRWFIANRKQYELYYIDRYFQC